uniref:Exocyst complex component Sec10-like alpha-helical bundle domain-containing protein n=1 Tax=Cyclophora tenuis TaxID=216820 RepID=A0A7S1D5Y7_CYCTE
MMFGTGKKGGETTARVITAIYNQMCNSYGKAYLYPIVEALGARLAKSPPNTPPPLQFDENDAAHDMGVPAQFWVSLEYIHSAAKQFDRELWAENRAGSARVWETLIGTGSSASMSTAKVSRLKFFAELETRGEDAIVAALDTLTNHIRWILVTGGESVSAIGGARFFSNSGSGGPYAIPIGHSLEQPNSPAVKLLTFCLRAQFVNVHAALTQQSLSAFWTALSKRLYDVFVPRLLQHYSVTTVGAVILSRDVESLRSVAMLSGANNHTHWDNLRELVTLYMTPPIALKSMLVGPDGDPNSAKGLFRRVGRYSSLVFMSRRADYRVKTAQGPRKSPWVVELLDDLGVQDPADGAIKMGFFAAEQKT